MELARPEQADGVSAEVNGQDAGRVDGGSGGDVDASAARHRTIHRPHRRHRCRRRRRRRHDDRVRSRRRRRQELSARGLRDVSCAPFDAQKDDSHTADEGGWRRLVDISLNGTHATTSSNTYPYRAMIETRELNAQCDKLASLVGRTVDRRKNCQLRPTTVGCLSHSAFSFVELS